MSQCVYIQVHTHHLHAYMHCIHHQAFPLLSVDIRQHIIERDGLSESQGAKELTATNFAAVQT